MVFYFKLLRIKHLSFYYYRSGGFPARLAVRQPDTILAGTGKPPHTTEPIPM